MTTCRVCEATAQGRTHIAREMMYGFRDEFEYYECPVCGCLQIQQVPSDLSKYYPRDYYSFRNSLGMEDTTPRGLRRLLRAARADYQIKEARLARASRAGAGPELFQL